MDGRGLTLVPRRTPAQLPDEVWQRVVESFYDSYTSTCQAACSVCCVEADEFEERAQGHLAERHGFAAPWVLPAWEHLGVAERRQLFELRTVSRPFYSALTAVLLATVMIPAGAEDLNGFNDHFSGLSDLPIRSLERVLELDRLRSDGDLDDSFWRSSSPTIADVLHTLHFVRHCRQLKSLSIISFQCGLADRVIETIVSARLSNLELGNLHEMDPYVLRSFFATHCTRLQRLALAYDPTELEVGTILGLLGHVRSLRVLSLGLDSSTLHSLHRRQLLGGTFPELVAPHYPPDVWHLEAILDRVGPGLVSLTVPFHVSPHHRHGVGPLSLSPELYMRRCFERCVNVEILSFTTFSGHAGYSRFRGTVDEVGMARMLEPLTRLRLLDASGISITYDDFLDLMDSESLELVQLDHGARERDVIVSHVRLEGRHLKYDAGNKMLVRRTTPLSEEGSDFAARLRALQAVEGSTGGQLGTSVAQQ